MSAGEQNPKISVSYRRTDSAMAGRIFDRLAQRFGKQSLFIDIDNIPFGGDFRKHVDDALKTSDLLIAMVGPKWVGGEGKDARIAREADPVRVEIETALKQNLPILPVLLDEARMPEPSELPENIRDFAYLNAVEVEAGRDFDVHVDRLIKAVEHILGAKAAPAVATSGKSPSEKSALVSPAPPAPPKAKRSLMPLALIGGLAALLAVAAAIWFARERASVAENVDPTTGTAYCADYKQVIGEARTSFSSLIGRRSGEAWISTTQLPGWDNCIVADWTNEGKIIRYFSCELPSVATLEELRAKRDAVVGYLQSCLGKHWAKKRTTFENGATDTRFTLGSDEPVAHVRESIYTDTRGNILRIDVDVPSSLYRDAPPETASEQPAAEEPPAAPGQAYCADLKRAVAAAPGNFDAILGPVSEDEVWISRVQLPGWEGCKVRYWTEQGKKRRYFVCVRGPFANLEAVRAKRVEAEAYATPCLGSDWSVRRSESSDKTIRTIYFMGPNDPEVTLREGFEKSEKWWFQIEVDAPAPLATPAEAPPDQPAPAPSPPQPSNQADIYCDDLKSVVAASRNNFADIRGDVLSEGSWISRVALPGWKDCTVKEWTSSTTNLTKRYFNCERGPLRGFEETRAKREAAEVYVKACLGPDWTVRHPKHDHNTIHSVFYLGSDDPEVRLREIYFDKLDEWVLLIDVDPPASLAVPAKPKTSQDQPANPPPSDQPLLPPPAPPSASEAAPNQPAPPPAAN